MSNVLHFSQFAIWYYFPSDWKASFLLVSNLALQCRFDSNELICLKCLLFYLDFFEEYFSSKNSELKGCFCLFVVFSFSTLIVSISFSSAQHFFFKREVNHSSKHFYLVQKVFFPKTALFKVCSSITELHWLTMTFSDMVFFTLALLGIHWASWIPNFFTQFRKSMVTISPKSFFLHFISTLFNATPNTHNETSNIASSNT